MTLVFVYGTLKRGHGNHRLLEASRFVGEAVSASACYAMHDCSFPILVDEPLGGRVMGELYAVDRRTLRSLDMLEGHPQMYCRRRRKFVTAAGCTYEAWVYLMPPDALARSFSRTPRRTSPVLHWVGRPSRDLVGPYELVTGCKMS